jgi:hypothetical protein
LRFLRSFASGGDNRTTPFLNLKLKIMAKVKTILPKLRANSSTYYNLDKRSVKTFQKDYAYLKKHEDKEVADLWIKNAKEMLKNKSYSDYVRKIKAINIIATHISH